MSERVILPVAANALSQRSARELLAMAWSGLAEAMEIRNPGLRYATAHLAALRGAAAVLAARAAPTPGMRRSRPTSVWTLVVMAAPEMQEWATHFAGTASKRAAAEAGIPRVVDGAQADELVRRARQFVAKVEVAIALEAIEMDPALAFTHALPFPATPATEVRP